MTDGISMESIKNESPRGDVLTFSPLPALFRSIVQSAAPDWLSSVWRKKTKAEAKLIEAEVNLLQWLCT